MAQSFSNMLVHIVFGTKNREPWLKQEVSRELYSYLARAAETFRCPALRVGGANEHVHLLCNLARTMTVAKLVEKLKVDTSFWLKKRGGAFESFYWQAGYGAFSVSAANSEQVSRYIQNQRRHHESQSFQDEFRTLLRRAGIEWDERYVWS